MICWGYLHLAKVDFSQFDSKNRSKIRKEFYNRAIHNGISKLGELEIQTNRISALRDSDGEKTIAGEPVRESIRKPRFIRTRRTHKRSERSQLGIASESFQDFMHLAPICSARSFLSTTVIYNTSFSYQYLNKSSYKYFT